LVSQVKNLARSDGLSLNEWLTRVMTVLTQADDAETPGQRLRSRLRGAGLLASGNPVAIAPPSEAALSEARRKAGAGTPLAEIVSADRR
jgi:hypothetical protein